MFIAALFTIAKICKQSKCSSADEWIKMWYMYAIENYSAIKKNSIIPFAEEGNGNPLQYSCLENPHGWRSMTGYSPWGRKELDTTEWLTYNAICSDMYATRDYHIKWSKSERERQTPYEITYMTQMNLFTKQTHKQRLDLWLQREKGRGIDWEFGGGRCKILHFWMDKQQGTTA